MKDWLTQLSVLVGNIIRDVKELIKFIIGTKKEVAEAANKIEEDIKK